MTNILNIIGLGGVVLGFAFLIVLTITLLKVVLRHEKYVAMAHPTAAAHNVLIKKYPGVDLRNYKTLILNLSLILSLGVVIAFFEMPIEDTRQLVQLTGHMGELEEMQEIPPTEQKLPPPPVIKNPEIVAVADEEIIEMEIEVDFSMEANENTIVEHAEVVVKEEKPVKEDIDEIFQIVEEPAAPIGGYETFYAYVSSQLHYPRKALDMQVSGKVYVKFVVDRDGSLTQLEVVRGIGFGCDEEALRVLAKAPKWKPGKQRGRNVRQQMIIPIVFKLADM